MISENLFEYIASLAMVGDLIERYLRELRAFLSGSILADSDKSAHDVMQFVEAKERQRCGFRNEFNLMLSLRQI